MKLTDSFSLTLSADSALIPVTTPSLHTTMIHLVCVKRSHGPFYRHRMEGNRVMVIQSYCCCYIVGDRISREKPLTRLDYLRFLLQQLGHNHNSITIKSGFCPDGLLAGGFGPEGKRGLV